MWIFSNYWMRLSRIWRILQVKEGSAYVDNTLQDLQNSSYPTKAEFTNCFIIHSKYFLLLKGVSPLRSFVFPVTKYNTTLSPGFLGQWFNNLQGAGLWRHWFNMVEILSKFGEQQLVIWWIMHVVLTNQKLENILNE